MPQTVNSTKPYYQDQYVTIYHGDCFDFSWIKCDLVLIDPPYNVGLGTKSHADRQKGYSQSVDAIPDWTGFVTSLQTLCMTVSERFVVTPGNSNQSLWKDPLWTLCWLKKNGVTRSPLTRGQKMNHACWEPILAFGKMDYPPHSDVIEIPIAMQPEAEDHPCPKPLKLFSRLLSFYEFDTVADFCMGSGTTLVAAKQMGRKAIGIDNTERYCEIAANRCAQEVLPLTFDEPTKVPETVELAL